MNTTLPNLSLGLLGGTFSGAVGAAPGEALLGQQGANALETAFGDSLEAALGADDLTEAADARDERDREKLETDAPNAAMLAPPAHLLAAFVVTAPPEVARHAMNEPVGTPDAHAVAPGAANATGSSDKPSAAQPENFSTTLGATESPAATGTASMAGMTATAETLFEPRDAGANAGAMTPDAPAPLPGRVAIGSRVVAASHASIGASPSPVAKTKTAVASSSADGFAPTSPAVATPATPGYSWSAADFGPDGAITTTAAQVAVPTDAIGADGYAPLGTAVSGAALTSALGDGSYGNYIIGQPAPAAPAPAPASPSPAAQPPVPQSPHAAPVTTASGQVSGAAKNGKNTFMRAAEAADAEEAEETDEPGEIVTTAKTEHAPTAVQTPDAPTPPPPADAPKAHEPHVKTVTAPEQAPTAPSEHSQEAVRIAEKLGHKRVLASGEARGHITTAELGRVEVTATTDASSNVQVNVQLDDAQARAVMEQQQAELRAHVQQDVPNANVNVDHRSGGNPANYGANDHRGQDAQAGERDFSGGRQSSQGTTEPAVQRQIGRHRGVARYVL